MHELLTAPGPRHAAPSQTDSHLVVALIPAHNEEASIGATVRSVLGQSRRPDRIVVIADNCNDATVEIAQSLNVEVIRTVGNIHRKAGALNYALDQVLPHLDDQTRVLTIDADTVLSPDWIENALRWQQARPHAGAICTIYQGRNGRGILPILQRIDYAQEARRVGRRQGRVDVLTGVATLFTAGLLRQVASERGTTVRGRVGEIYDVDSLTEDFEITLAIKQLGYLPISPRDVVAVTDVMATWADLKRQRTRWQRGTVETLMAYGYSRLTRRHWVTQVWSYGLSLVFPLMLGLLALSWYVGGISYEPIWLLTLPLFYAEHILLSWRLGWKEGLVAISIVPFWIYENFRIFVFWFALYKAMRNGERRWA